MYIYRHTRNIFKIGIESKIQTLAFVNVLVHNVIKYDTSLNIFIVRNAYLSEIRRCVKKALLIIINVYSTA